MLVLGRKINESIIIGDDITVMVTAIDGNTVKLGVTAPRGVRVDRAEIRTAKERSRANGVDGGDKSTGNR